MTVAVAEQTSSRRAWIAVGSAWLSAVVLFLIWLLATSAGDLREQLKIWQFWSLEACVFLAVLVGVSVGKALMPTFDRRDGLRIAVLAAVALALTLGMAPRTNRIFYDEQIYQNVGQNLADAKLGQMCNDGSIEYGEFHCAYGEYNKQPYAYPHLLSIVYRLVGVREGAAFAVNAAAVTLTVASVYLLVCVLFGDRNAAFLAGLLLALTPEQLIWSATAAVEPSASLALVVALLCGAHYLRTGGMAALAALAVAAAYAIQFRPESLLMLPVLGALTWPRLQDDLRRPAGWWVGLLFFVLVAVHLGHLYAVRHADWGTTGARFSLAYVPANLRVNGWFYLYDARFPVVFSLLALGGLASRDFRWERAAMVAYFSIFFMVGLVFYAGSYNYGADVRYSLMTYPPIAVLGGLGAARLVRAFTRLHSGVPAQTLVVTALAFVFLCYTPVVRATTEEAWAARADVRFARSVARELPPHSYVLTHNPGMFHVWGVNAGQLSRVVTNDAYADFLNTRNPGGVYVHWNFWCNVDDPVQRALCPEALALRPVELVHEYRERDQRFAFYRMKASH